MTLTDCNRANDHERNNRLDGRCENLRLVLRPSLWDIWQLLRRQGCNENCTDTHRTKVACENCLTEGLDVRDPTIQRENDRKAPKEENEQADDEETPGSKCELDIGERLERHPSAEVDEGRDVEEL